MVRAADINKKMGSPRRPKKPRVLSSGKKKTKKGEELLAKQMLSYVRKYSQKKPKTKMSQTRRTPAVKRKFVPGRNTK